MPDTFKTSVELKSRGDDDVWQTAEYLLEYLERTLRSLGGRLYISDVDLADREDSSLQRPTAAEARGAAREYHVVPVRLSASMRYKEQATAVNEERTSLFEPDLVFDPDVEVGIWATFKANWNRRASLRVWVESSDKILLDGLTAKLAAERDFLAGGIPRGDVGATRARGANPRVTSVKHEVMQAAGARPLVRGSSPSQSWIRRSWRDHTATFLITVLGTVAAAAVVLWLGLTP